MNFILNILILFYKIYKLNIQSLKTLSYHLAAVDLDILKGERGRHPDHHLHGALVLDVGGCDLPRDGAAPHDERLAVPPPLPRRARDGLNLALCQQVRDLELDEAQQHLSREECSCNVMAVLWQCDGSVMAV